MTATIGSVSIDLEARLARFESDFGRAARITEREMAKMSRAVNAQLAQINARMEKFSAGAARMFTGLFSGLSVGALVAFEKKLINVADSINDLSKKFGISTEALSVWRLSAEKSGTSLDGIARAAKILTKDLEGSEIKLRSMGIAMRDSAGNVKPMEQIMEEVAKKFAGYKEGAEKAAAATALFGKSGTDMIPFLDDFGRSVDESKARAMAFGVVLGPDFTKQADEWNDNLRDAQAITEGFGNGILAVVLPALNNFMGGLNDSAAASGGLVTAGEEVGEWLKRFVLGVILAKNAVDVLIDGLKFFGSAVLTVFTSAAEQIGAFATFTKTSFATIFDVTRSPIERMREMGAAQGALWSSLKASSAKALDGLARDADKFGDAYIKNVAEAGDALDAYYTPPVKVAGEETRKLGDKAQETAPHIRDMADAQAEAALAAKDLAEATRRSKEEQDDQLRTFAGVIAANKAAYDALHKTIDALKEENATIGMSADELKLHNAERELTNALLAAHVELSSKSAVAAMKEVNALVKRNIELKKTADNAQRVESILSQFDNLGFGSVIKDIGLLEEALRQATDPGIVARLQGAMGELQHSMNVAMISSTQEGLRSLQSMSAEGSKAFKLMQIAIDALSLAQAISAVLNQGQGDPYTAFARMAAMAAAVATLVGSIGGSFGGSNGMTDTAADRQQTQGTGTVLGDAEAQSESIRRATEITADATSELVGINRGMLRALLSLQDAIGGASNMLARGANQSPFAAPHGAASFSDTFSIGSGLAFSDPLNILGGSSNITDLGISIGGTLGNIVASAYREEQYRTWRFGSRHTDTDTVALPGNVTSQFQLVMDSIVDTVRQGALALGMMPEEIEAALAAYTLAATTISLQDLSAEEQQAELEAVFSSIFDGLAGHVVPFIAQFQEVGEGLGETLIRVATSVQVTQESIARLGLALDETDPEKFAQISVALIEAAGGIEAFISGMDSFIDAFATDEFKFELATSDLTRGLEQVGLAVPATRAEMWELMQSLDATTESGREQIATLLRLAGTADDYYTSLENMADTMSELEESTGSAREEIERLAELFAANAAEIADILGTAQWDDYIAGLSDYDAQVAEINRSYDERSDRLIELGATEAQIAELEGYRANELARLGDSLEDLGEAIVTVTASIDAGVQVISRWSRLQEIMQEVARALGSSIQSVAAQAENLRIKWRELFLEAHSLGASEGQLTLLRTAANVETRTLIETERDRLLGLTQASNEFQDWLDAQRFSDTSTLTPQEQLAEARRQFDALIASGAPAGEITAMGDTLLGLGRDFWSSGPDFDALQAYVRDSVQALAAAVTTDQALLDALARMNELLEQINSGRFFDFALPVLPATGFTPSDDEDGYDAEWAARIAERIRLAETIGAKPPPSEGKSAQSGDWETQRMLRDLLQKMGARESTDARREERMITVLASLETATKRGSR